MDHTFTIDRYRQIVRAFLEEGYRFTSFAEFSSASAKRVLLRHDIDLSMEKAVEVAQIEAELGVSSVYHLLITAEIYNPLSAAGQSCIHQIRQLGHRIGLHVDPVATEHGHTHYATFHDSLAELFRLGEAVLGPLDSYSIHRPSTNGKIDDLKPERLPFPVPIYADSDAFRRDILYRSDSRRQWRHGDILAEIPSLDGQSIQLNLHPIWWTNQKSTRDAVLGNLADRRQEATEHYLESNLSFYRRPRCSAR